MGQASRRGTYEERVAQSKLNTLHEAALREDKVRTREKQEVQAIETMVWWQFEMTYERYELHQKRFHKRSMVMAQTLGMLYGGFGALTYDYVPGPRRLR